MHFDFETRCNLNLKKTSLSRYLASPHFRPLERVHRFPIRCRIHGSAAACDSSIESEMEAKHGAGLQRGFA